MRTVRLFLCLLLTGSLLIETGCWNRRELNELAIAVGVGLDKSGDKYKLSVQVVDPAAVAPRKGGGGGSPVILYQTEENTIFEAFRKLTTITPRRIYPSHLRILVIGEELAKEGIAKSLDLLARDWELRSDFFMTVARGEKAENVLKVLTPIEQIPANKLYSSLKTSEKIWAPTRVVRLDDFITDFLSEGKQPVISGVSIIGETAQSGGVDSLKSVIPKARLQYSNIAVFKEDRLIGWLNELESKGYNYIIDNVDNTVGPIPCPDGSGSINLEILHTTTKVEGSVRNGKPHIEIMIKSQENIGEVECDYDLAEDESIQRLEALAAKRTEEIINISLRKVQKVYKSDIFGFGDAIHRADKEYWKRHKEQWADIFPTVEVNVKSEITIRETGTINNSFLRTKKGASS